MPPGFGPNPALPPLDEELIPTVSIAPAERRENDEKPVPGEGLAVNLFADGFDHPRWLHGLPNGDGRADEKHVFLENLNSRFGVALIGSTLHVAGADAIMVFPYADGDTRIEDEGRALTDLPAGPINHHWTKIIISSRDGARLCATVGSNGNVAENGLEAEEGRAAIWEVDVASGAKRLFASGSRNPNGLGREPATGALRTVVSERDEIGDDLPPDCMTRVRDGDFYGWPYGYCGRNLEPRVEARRPGLVASAIPPDYALGRHTASLGLAFADGAARQPEVFRNGVFIGQHGSWSRSEQAGYEVISVPFAEGAPSGPPVDALTGFVDDEGQAQGRPLGVAIAQDGASLVADDVGDRVWRMVARA
jgi:glucose/arabinose dehydrogenase